MSFVYVVGVRAIQFGNNRMKKIPRTAKVNPDFLACHRHEILSIRTRPFVVETKTPKLLKINISLITSNDFRRLCPLVL